MIIASSIVLVDVRGHSRSRFCLQNRSAREKASILSPVAGSGIPCPPRYGARVVAIENPNVLAKRQTSEAKYDDHFRSWSNQLDGHILHCHLARIYHCCRTQWAAISEMDDQNPVIQACLHGNKTMTLCAAEWRLTMDGHL